MKTTSSPPTQSSLDSSSKGRHLGWPRPPSWSLWALPWGDITGEMGSPGGLRPHTLHQLRPVNWLCFILVTIKITFGLKKKEKNENNLIPQNLHLLSPFLLALSAGTPRNKVTSPWQRLAEEGKRTKTQVSGRCGRVSTHLTLRGQFEGGGRHRPSELPGTGGRRPAASSGRGQREAEPEEGRAGAAAEKPGRPAPWWSCGSVTGRWLSVPTFYSIGGGRPSLGGGVHTNNYTDGSHAR